MKQESEREGNVTMEAERFEGAVLLTLRLKGPEARERRWPLETRKGRKRILP